MSWTVKLDMNLNIIVTTFAGDLKINDLIDASNERLKWVKNTGITRLLVEIKEMDIDTSETFSVYELVDKHYGKSELNRKMKIAITSSKHKQTDEIAHFYETVNMNRGYNCKKFDKRDTAIQWLLEK